MLNYELNCFCQILMNRIIRIVRDCKPLSCKAIGICAHSSNPLLLLGRWKWCAWHKARFSTTLRQHLTVSVAFVFVCSEFQLESFLVNLGDVVTTRFVHEEGPPDQVGRTNWCEEHRADDVDKGHVSCDGKILFQGFPRKTSKTERFLAKSQGIEQLLFKGFC